MQPQALLASSLQLGGNGVLRLTDEIKTVLSTTVTPPTTTPRASISHSSSQDALTPRLVFSGSMSFALTSHSSTEAIKKPPLWPEIGQSGCTCLSDLSLARKMMPANTFVRMTTETQKKLNCSL